MSIIDCLVSNVIVSAALALVAAFVGKLVRQPQVRHALWVLVLVKLITPPVLQVPLPLFSPKPNLAGRSASLAFDAGSKQLPTDGSVSDQTILAHMSDESEATTPGKSAWMQVVPWPRILWSVWLAGMLIWYVIAGTRLWRFRKSLSYARTASDEIQSEVGRIASKYALSRTPRVVVANANIPPLIWSFSRKTTIVLPGDLLSRLTTEERVGMLAHELAHLKRGDHWIRWFELFVLGVYWWNPVAWWARAQVQQAEEECCDSWVLWAFPDHAIQYAQTLVDTVDFLVGQTLKPVSATAFISQSSSLKRRIEIILAPRLSRRLSWKLKSVLMLFALIVAPIFVVRQGVGNEDSQAVPKAPSDRAQGDIKRIQGSVVDKEGKAISGATLWYEYAFSRRSRARLGVDTRSNADGRFVLEIPTIDQERLEPSSSLVWAYSPGHCLGSSHSIGEQAADAKKDIRIELAPATDTSLRVLDSNGQPAADVIVDPINYRSERGYDLVPESAWPVVGGRTDAAGRVRLPAMARDRLFLVWLTSDDYGIQSQQFTVHPAEPAERTIRLREVCQIEGRVIADDPKWARALRLIFTSEERFRGARPPWPTEGYADVATDLKGRFVVPVIASGRLRIETVIDEDGPVRPVLPQLIEATAGETTKIEIPMRELVGVQGSIVAKDTGEPLVGVKLHVYYGEFRQGTDVISDAQGRFTARVLPGRIRLQPMNLSKTKYLQLGSPQWHDVPDDADGFQLPVIEVVASIPLEGRLVDQDNLPVADARVTAYYKNWLCSTANTRDDGRFQLPKMPVSVAARDATYRVTLGVGEMRSMRKGEVNIIDRSPFTLRVKR